MLETFKKNTVQAVLEHEINTTPVYSASIAGWQLNLFQFPAGQPYSFSLQVFEDPEEGIKLSLACSKKNQQYKFDIIINILNGFVSLVGTKIDVPCPWMGYVIYEYDGYLHLFATKRNCQPVAGSTDYLYVGALVQTPDPKKVLARIEAKE